LSRRRRFLGQVAMGGAGLLTGKELLGGEGIDRRREVEMEELGELDVIVFGGGPAGIVAATQSARAGARTMLVEKNGMLGGTTTSAGVNFPGLFHAWGQQVIAGIGWELVERCVETSKGSMPDFSAVPDRHWKHQVRVNRAVYAALADEMVIESGANVLFHAMPASLKETEDHVQFAVCTKTGMLQGRSKVAVDCTGDANALDLAGCALIRPERLQPGTLMVRLSGYDLKDVNKEVLLASCRRALDTGELRREDCPQGAASAWRVLASHGDNSLDVTGVDGATSRGRTAAELAGRGILLRLYRFFRAQPGLEGLTVEYMAPECGIRETVTIDGLERITVEDYLSGKVWPEAVCNSFYPVDWHRSDGHGIEKRKLQEGVVPTVPRGSLLPRERSRLIAGGRCVSSDPLANSALRVQATCMAVGQAAGGMAALASQSGAEPKDVNMEDLRRLLKKHHAIVP